MRTHDIENVRLLICCIFGLVCLFVFWKLGEDFILFIHFLGDVAKTATVDEDTREFFAELSDPGTYRVLVTTISSSGECEPRESAPQPGLTFYLSVYSSLSRTLMWHCNVTL